MTDKQIIIDGVDVSGCVKLRPYNECGCQPIYGGSYGLCSEWGNCYYKHLKRAEKTMQEIWDRLGKTSDELLSKEQECEKLKETFDDLFKVQYKLADTNKKLRQCITEIKEIAEINPINTCWTVLELCEKCDENKECDIQCPFFKFKLILQKISECEE